jgi:apolipoprotein D and lipocalin family protein
MRYSIPCAMLATLAACSSPPPIQTAQAVDLERFMGDWYVIANIPTWIERDAHNAMESYRLAEDGTVATTFRFRKGGFEGDLKTFHPTDYILDRKSNAIWECSSSGRSRLTIESFLWTSHTVGQSSGGPLVITCG